MKDRKGKIFRRIATLCLAFVMAVSSVPLSGLAAKSDKKKEGWDGTFESEVLGKAPKGWEIYATEANESVKPSTAKYDNWHSLYVTDGKDKGTKSLLLEGHNFDNKVPHGYVFAEAPLLDVQGGKEYAVNYMLKLQGVENKEKFLGARVYVTQYDKAGKELQKQRLGNIYTDNVDWDSYSKYILMEAETTQVKISLWLGGFLNYTKNVKLFIDEISVEALENDKLINGGFERGEGNNDIYSWHLRSTNNINSLEWNKPTEYNSYFIVERVKGYHGDAISITRPETGLGYVALESNLVETSPGSTHIVDYALKILVRNEETFLGAGCYISEFDKNQKLIARKSLHANITELTDWKEMTASYTAGQDAAYIRIELWLGDYYGNVAGHKGHPIQVCFDDVRLTSITRSTSNDGVHNGNFEEVYDGTIFDWTFSERENIFYFSTFDGYNNSKGLLVTKATEDKHGILPFESNVFNVVEGQQYKASAMARFGNQMGNVYLVMYVNFYGADGKRIEQFRADDLRTNSEDWQQQAGFFTAPKGSKTAKMEFIVCGTTFNCWIDDITWSAFDDKADIWGFDAVGKDGQLAGWTVSTEQKAAKLDKKVYREGTGSLYLSQTSDTSITKITSDLLIPVEKQSRYIFNAWVKSYDCNVTTESIRVGAYLYNKDGENIGWNDGLYRALNEEAQPSDWKELILAINTGVDVAYVRPYIKIAAGSMKLWLDDFSWRIYDMEKDFTENFDTVREDGTPDGWEAIVSQGTPKFYAGNSVAQIEANSSEDQGILRTRWDSAMEYTSMSFNTTYATLDEAKAKVTIKFYGYDDKEIENARVEQMLENTGGKGQEFSFDFILSSAKYMILELSNEGKGSISFDGISITQKEDLKKETADITWRGKWIWYQEEYTASVNGPPRYFRYHFNLPSQAVASNIQITADDRLTLWINGMEVKDDNMDQDYGYVSVIEGLEQYLVPGENVIAVSVVNFTVHAGLLFDGYAECENGEYNILRR